MVIMKCFRWIYGQEFLRQGVQFLTGTLFLSILLMARNEADASPPELRGGSTTLEFDQLRPGDLIYIHLRGRVGDAIEETTGSPANHMGIVAGARTDESGASGEQASHRTERAGLHTSGVANREAPPAMPERESGGCGLTVIHSYAQVREEPLERFLTRGDGRYSVNRPDFECARIQDQFVAAARTMIGLPYDRKYRIDNDSIYCSELIYRAFLDGPSLIPVPLEPMDFTGLSPEAMEAWERFFDGDIPQGHPGIAPGDYLETTRFAPIHDGLSTVNSN